MTKIVHITPRFAPQIDGVGDYAFLLATKLKQTHAFASRVIVGEPSWYAANNGASSFGGFPAAALTRRDDETLRSAIADAEAIILHYVSYGYHKRGVPFWINRAIRDWKRAASSLKPRRLIIVFHELWASGPPWRSEFFLGPIQKCLIRELHRLADASITSTPNMYCRLEALERGKTTFAPIPSCAQPPPLADRHWHSGGPVTLVIFGQEASRKLTVETHSKLIRSLHVAGLLKELRAVGKGCIGGKTPSADVAALRALIPAELITIHRDLTADQLAVTLSGSDLFLSYYPSAFLCKSSALTAAMACGCPPVLRETHASAPLRAGQEVLACDGSDSAIAKIMELIATGHIERLGRAAQNWYDANASWQLTTNAVAGHLRVHH